MKKKIILSTLVALFPVFLFLYFNSNTDKSTAYDISQQGITESKGKFIPEQKTDYIFTTVEVEYGFIEITVVCLLIITVIIIILVRKKSKITKSDS